MINRNDVAIFAARNLAIAVLALVLGNAMMSGGLGIGEIISSIFISLVFWVLGFLFSLTLLIPLEKVFHKISETASFVVFLTIGALIPALIMLGLNSLMNRFQSFNQTSITENIFAYGALGAITAGSAWWYLNAYKAGKNGN